VLSVNEFEGQLPASFGNASSLEVIDLSSNRFSGQVPISFGSLLQLSYLNLENNMLEASDDQGWEFLHALKNCTLLNSFSLGRNRLSGSIPNYIGELSSELEFLDLSSNELSGLVPSRIGNLTGLATLGLDNNSLTGPIGEWVGMLKDLQDLELQQEQLRRPHPSVHWQSYQIVASPS
jgi:Leucine-rich repeat (LRR) protein